MTFLRAVAPRIFIDTNPYVERFPIFDENVFYQTGSVVTKSFQVSPTDSENVYYNFYVAVKDTSPSSLTPDKSNNWVIWVSGDPSLPTFYTDSDIYVFLGAVQTSYIGYFNNTDSDVSALDSKVKAIFGFETEIAKIKHDIKEVKERNVLDSLTDSEAQDKKVISWDSDTGKFKFVMPVLSVNNITPDANGNVNFVFTTTKTGSMDQRLDSDENGTIYVVNGDSDSDSNGMTFTYTDSGWVRMLGYTDKENESRYVDLIGDTMTGPLLLSREPQSDSEAATKAYVDGFNDSDKQDKIITVSTVAGLFSLTPETGRIYYVKQNSSLWIYIDGTMKQFSLPAKRIFDPVLLEVTRVILTPGQFNLEVNTYRFSSFLPGTLTIIKNGSTNLPFIILNNISGTYEANNSVSNFKLVDAGNQTFIVRVAQTYDAAATYRLVFTAHDGHTTTVILGQENAVSFSEANRTFNFGEY